MLDKLSFNYFNIQKRILDIEATHYVHDDGDVLYYVVDIIIPEARGRYLYPSVAAECSIIEDWQNFYEDDEMSLEELIDDVDRYLEKKSEELFPEGIYLNITEDGFCLMYRKVDGDSFEKAYDRISNMLLEWNNPLVFEAYIKDGAGEDGIDFDVLDQAAREHNIYADYDFLCDWIEEMYASCKVEELYQLDLEEIEVVDDKHCEDTLEDAITLKENFLEGYIPEDFAELFEEGMYDVDIHENFYNGHFAKFGDVWIYSEYEGGTFKYAYGELDVDLLWDNHSKSHLEKPKDDYMALQNVHSRDGVFTELKETNTIYKILEEALDDER